jgi:hypothetical protein
MLPATASQNTARERATNAAARPFTIRIAANSVKSNAPANA